MSESKHKIEPVIEVKRGHVDDLPDLEPADTETCLKRRDRFKHALSQFDSDMQIFKEDIFKYALDERML